MTLLDIADMLALKLGTEEIYAGNIDANQQRCIGVYNAKSAGLKKICLGGKACTKTLEKKISILIHWTDDPSQAERKAQAVSAALSELRNCECGDYILKFVQSNDPVDVGRDERGICEYVIECRIYYERKD